MSQKNRERTNWIGVCLLVIGIAYLSKNHHWDFFNLHHYLPHNTFSWQVILVVIGFLLILVGRNVGIALMLIGAVFLFTEEILTAFIHFHQWWPLALIVAGIVLLARSGSGKKINS